ncbi:basic proline-rich protein-like [Sarcophilus harrisii]|uniref:basic proline-rich protein-like n=1 Tax=Sarcophilus harrisii TaxID=9305 RepID=UPI001301B516|nr:basic proline-rich protein-like [Sarcophilus harrisii]
MPKLPGQGTKEGDRGVAGRSSQTVFPKFPLPLGAVRVQRALEGAARRPAPSACAPFLPRGFLKSWLSTTPSRRAGGSPCQGAPGLLWARPARSHAPGSATARLPIPLPPGARSGPARGSGPLLAWLSAASSPLPAQQGARKLTASPSVLPGPKPVPAQGSTWQRPEGTGRLVAPAAPRQSPKALDEPWPFKEGQGGGREPAGSRTAEQRDKGPGAPPSGGVSRCRRRWGEPLLGSGFAFTPPGGGSPGPFVPGGGGRSPPRPGGNPAVPGGERVCIAGSLPAPTDRQPRGRGSPSPSEEETEARAISRVRAPLPVAGRELGGGQGSRYGPRAARPPGSSSLRPGWGRERPGGRGHFGQAGPAPGVETLPEGASRGASLPRPTQHPPLPAPARAPPTPAPGAAAPLPPLGGVPTRERYSVTLSAPTPRKAPPPPPPCPRAPAAAVGRPCDPWRSEFDRGTFPGAEHCDVSAPSPPRRPPL